MEGLDRNTVRFEYRRLDSQHLSELGHPVGLARAALPGLSAKALKANSIGLDRAFTMTHAGCAVNLTPSARATFITVSNRGLAPGARAL